MSLDTWLRPTAPFLTFRTYYVKGRLAALDLDLAIRGGSGGRHALDELMRTLLHDPGLARSGYTTQDLVVLTGRLADRPMDGWFRRVAAEPGYLDLEPALRRVGLRPEPDPEAAAWTGLRLAGSGEPRGTVARWVEPGLPSERAGLGALAPGVRARLTVVRGDRVLEAVLEPEPRSPLRVPVRVTEDPNAPPGAVAARRSWLWLDR